MKSIGLLRHTYNYSNYLMYHPLGPDVVLSTTTEEEETTEEKETTGKFFAKPCFVTILSLQF